MYVAQLESIPGGRPGLLVKVKRIRELVEKAKRDPRFRARVLAVVQHLGERDHDGEIEYVVDWVRDGIRYVRDPWSKDGLELFQSPQLLLDDIERGRAAGDCDDHVLLASAALEVLGYPTRYRVGGARPDRYRHIWIDVQHPTRGWLPVELTQDRPVGWDPSGNFELLETLGEPMSQTIYSPGFSTEIDYLRAFKRHPQEYSYVEMDPSHGYQHAGYRADYEELPDAMLGGLGLGQATAAAAAAPAEPSPWVELARTVATTGMQLIQQRDAQKLAIEQARHGIVAPPTAPIARQILVPTDMSPPAGIYNPAPADNTRTLLMLGGGALLLLLLMRRR